MIVCVAFSATACGGEFFGREGDAAEHFAGVFGAAAVFVAAFPAGNGVVQYRHDQLGFLFQPHDGELAQSHEQLPLASGDHQRLLKKFPDAVGDLYRGTAATAAGIRLPHLGRQNHGVQNFHCEHQFDRR